MKILVLGKGIANEGVCELLKEEKIAYDYLDIKEVENLDYDFVVKAPGIPMNENLILKFLAKKVKIVTDIGLAAALRKKIYIGVTGSNGKTTTVSLITHILSKQYKTIACGNIGYSVCKALVEHKEAEIFVVELSSFQLECADLDLDISVLLNIHPCHQDHHNSYKEYILSKQKICIRQRKNHYCVYHFDDPILKEMVKNTSATLISFSKTSCLTKCYLHHDFLFYENKKIMKLNEDILRKPFLLEDIMASISVVQLIKGVSTKIIKQQIKTFKEIEFRLTKINDYIYNDAKSTNPYSTLAALECFHKVLLICGGYDRKEDLSCLKPVLYKIQCVYAYGESKEKVKKYMEENQVECKSFQNLDDAFLMAFKERKEETILFSPMFASFDFFSNYIERGKYFNKIVRENI